MSIIHSLQLWTTRRVLHRRSSLVIGKGAHHIIYTIYCPGKFRSLTLLSWFPFSCPVPFGSFIREQTPQYWLWWDWSLLERRCPQGLGHCVNPFRTGNLTSSGLGELKVPTHVCPATSIWLQGWTGPLSLQQEAGRTQPGISAKCCSSC